MQPKNQSKIFLFLLCIWFLLQIFTLDKVPLPWFDEVFFKSLADNLWQNNSFQIPIIVFEDEIKIYGFIYFYLVIFFQFIVGDSIFGFRLCNFLAGLCVVFWFWKKNTDNPYQKIWLFIFLFDPFFNLCLHEGRMDLTATFLILLAFDRLSKPTYFHIFVGSFLGVLALLITPRSAFAGVGLGFLLILSVYSTQKSILITFQKSILSLLIVIGFYSIWIFVAFGSFTNFLQNFIGVGAIINKESSLFGWFVGGTLYIPKHQYLLLLMLFLVIILALFHIQKIKKSTKKIEIFVFFVLIISFHILVKDYGQYSIFILCFYYLLLIYFLEIINKKAVYFVVLGVLLSFNFVYFSLKNIQVFLTYPQRNMTTAREFIEKNIPKNSKVIGEALYMYAVTHAGSQYQLFEVYDELEKREKKQREIFKYQYLIITNQSKKKHSNIINYYFSKNKKLKIKAILYIPIDNLRKKIIENLPLSQNENEGYNATIYEVIE